MEFTKSIHVLVGLPGSGKTTWARKYMSDYINSGKNIRNNVRYSGVKLVNCDLYLEQEHINTIEDVLKEAGQYDSYGKYDEIILDGLFLNNTPIINALKYIFNAEKNDREYYVNWEDKNAKYQVIIDYWEPNIELCLYNDNGRRNKNSEITIKNAKIDVNLYDLKLEFPEIEFHKHIHTVEKATAWDKFKFKYGYEYNGTEKEYITSNSWTTGGTWANCWGTGGTCSAEPESDFEQLDIILQNEYPEISYLKFKELKKRYIQLEEWGDCDYYGGCENKAMWKIKVKDLYDFLVENGKIINDN